MPIFLFFLTLFLLPLQECGKAKTIGNTAGQSIDLKSFYFGADLSYVNQILDQKGIYRDAGTATSPYKIFKDRGANLIRLRLWHNPLWTKEVYGDSGKHLYSDIIDVEKAIRLSKEQGMEVELDFHYSDGWADPGKQEAPGAWKNIRDVSVLKDSIYQYTRKTLQYLDEKGLMPEWVQVGNEINCGMFHTKAPDGFPFANACKGEWERLGGYLNSGIQAVRDAGATSAIKPKILIHVADPIHVEKWFDNITSKGMVSDFDAIGFSYYPLWHTRITLDSISNIVSHWKNKFGKEIMVLETAYPWTSQGNDQYRNAFGSQQPLDGFPFTRQGQHDFLVALTREVMEGGGRGIIYWEPAWISSTLKDLWGTGSSWENAALFDFNGNTTKGIEYMKFPYNR